RAATTSDAFNAIAEPQRREILVLLRGGGRPVTGLARDLGVRQPQASKHRRGVRGGGVGGVRGAGREGRDGRGRRGVRAVRGRVAAGARVAGRLRAVLERELRPAGGVRAGPETAKSGGTIGWRRPVAAASPSTRPRTARSCCPGSSAHHGSWCSRRSRRSGT